MIEITNNNNTTDNNDRDDQNHYSKCRTVNILKSYNIQIIMSSQHQHQVSPSPGPWSSLSRFIRLRASMPFQVFRASSRLGFRMVKAAAIECHRMPQIQGIYIVIYLLIYLSIYLSIDLFIYLVYIKSYYLTLHYITLHYIILSYSIKKT